MEKHTEHIGYNYITKLFNITQYHTEGNKRLFNNKFPDGWLLKDNKLLIIEYKPNKKQKAEGINQLYNYVKLVLSNDENNYLKNNIYCFLGIGTDAETFNKCFMWFDGNKLKRKHEQEIKNIFINDNRINKRINNEDIYGFEDFDNISGDEEIIEIIEKTKLTDNEIIKLINNYVAKRNIEYKETTENKHRLNNYFIQFVRKLYNNKYYFESWFCKLLDNWIIYLIDEELNQINDIINITILLHKTHA